MTKGIHDGIWGSMSEKGINPLHTIHGELPPRIPQTIIEIIEWMRMFELSKYSPKAKPTIWDEINAKIFFVARDMIL